MDSTRLLHTPDRHSTPLPALQPSVQYVLGAKGLGYYCGSAWQHDTPRPQFVLTPRCKVQPPQRLQHAETV